MYGVRSVYVPFSFLVLKIIACKREQNFTKYSNNNPFFSFTE